MAGISVSLEGSNIQLAFQKDDQATAVVMDARAARALVRAGGQAVVALQAGALPPFHLRLTDEEARHVATSLLEILAAPRDVRASHGGH